MSQPSPMSAPKHLVDRMAATFQLPPHEGEQEARHRAQCQMITDQIWHEAYTKGAIYGMAISQRTIILVTEERQADVLAKISGDPAEAS